MIISQHIAARGSKGTYQLRLAVPRRLRSIVGRREFTQSLGTSDRREAERRALPILSDWQQTLDRAEREGSSRDPRKIAYEVGFEWLLDRLETEQEKIPDDAGAFRAHILKREDELFRIVRQLRGGRTELIEHMADGIIAKNSMAMEKGSASYREFIVWIGEGVVEAVSVFLRRNKGDLAAEPQNVALREHMERKSSPDVPREGMQDLLEQYISQRVLEKRKRTASAEKDRKIIQNFFEYAGQDRAVHSISRRDVRDWIQARASMPRGYEKMSSYVGMPLRSAVQAAKTDKRPRVGPKTLNTYLSAISAFFRWLIARDHHDGPSPCDGLFYDAIKGDNPRPPYTTDEINLILSSPLYTGFLRDGAEHQPGSLRTRDWRFWIPLVCLFTGARISEIAQLRVEDVREDQEGWFILIRHDDEASLSTKSGKSRFAPIHTKLAEMGFVLFCEKRRRDASAAAEPLFPDAQNVGSANAGDQAARFWRDYLKRIGVKSNKDGGDGLGAHSFRHTIADRFREEAELFDADIGVALGHTVRTVTSGYGQVQQGTVNRLRGMFEAVRFDGVRFEHLKRQ